MHQLAPDADAPCRCGEIDRLIADNTLLVARLEALEQAVIERLGTPDVTLPVPFCPALVFLPIYYTLICGNP